MSELNDIIDCGLDVGSTTVKCVLLDERNNVLWKEYRRHNGHQADCVKECISHINEKYPDTKMRIAITGSGSRSLRNALDAQFIQEVNALTLAVETLIPEANSVIELGGQDAKVILWKGDENNRHILTYMNDKCAGGTGSTIDKIMSKIRLSLDDAAKITLENKQIHHIAAKCGVFAETDVVGLLKMGVSKEEIFISLCSAIVKQNIEVLVHGNVLSDKVVLLGGPNTYIPVLCALWRDQIAETWKIHGFSPSEPDLQKAIIIPNDSQYFAAIGAILFARENHSLHISNFKQNWHEQLAQERKKRSGDMNKGLVENEEELELFKKKYTVPKLEKHDIQNAQLEVFIGIDGGSTSTKTAIIDKNGELLYSDYVLSNGNPLEDAQLLFKNIKQWQNEHNARIKILGTAITGYASQIIKTALNLDITLVETIAHYRAAVELYGDVDVICDVGGQDIKVLFIKNKRVADFRLNTQCSAGNGYFLQAMADQFHVPIEQYAEMAFKAKVAPKFNYGCAVFMEQDRVNFQQAGWKKEEMMCGLAQVLPLNIWNYVVQESNLAKFGKRFVLQGGTQHNLAAVKAQVDFIHRKVPNAEVIVHTYAGIAGAIGAALEARKKNNANGTATSTFIGINEAANITFTSRNDESTICKKCNNHCKRTFIEIENSAQKMLFISGHGCEMGSSQDNEIVKEKQRKLKEIFTKNPDISEVAAHDAFSHFEFEKLPEHGTSIDRNTFYPAASQRIVPKNEWEIPFQRNSKTRDNYTIAIPKLLNMFYFAPLFTAYFETLGIKVVFSDFTNQKLWENGNKWGAIDPCFPAKVAPAHIWQLLNMPDVNAIFFPIITNLVSDVQCTLGNTACVIQMGTPEVAEAVFTTDRNIFKEKNIAYFDPSLNMDRYNEACDKMHAYFADIFQITRDENAWAFNNGVIAMQTYLTKQRKMFTDTINNLIAEDRVGILLIGHPYHHDFGLNHKIPEEFRKCGYPIFTIESIPTDNAFLSQLFENESQNRIITDVWARNFNRNTNHKVWAAKVAARHPNLAVVDLSSFKCGHDAPTYNYIDNILDVSQTPHFIFHDIDQNRPSSTFKIRIETADYFLKEYERENLRGEKSSKKQWEGFNNPVWDKKDKKKVIILYNMIEENKSFFLQAYFHRCGYRYRDLGNHTKNDFLLGREYGTRMQCNPVYFTLGTFVDELLRIEKEEGLSKEEIVANYVFLAGGGQCGPCRYGMYPKEYLKVTNAMGFHDFRILIFNSDIVQDPPMPKNSAFKFSPYFKIHFALCFILADLIHIAECAIRPYAKDKTAAMRVIDECKKDILQAFKSHLYLFKLPAALYKAGRKIAKIEKINKKIPLIFITGEIFANLAHGDANYNLRRFIADEGCEVIPGMFTQRGIYEGWSKNYRYFEHLKYAKDDKTAQFCKNYIRRQNFSITFVKKAYNFLDFFYNQKQFGGRGEFHDFDELSKLGHEHYHTSIFGGEGNLEIAEAIYYHDRIDGFISVKPFGCMPSNGVSDGIQSKITAMYPNLNFLSIETSGDNDVSILSRVSMMLFKAKQKLERQG